MKLKKYFILIALIAMNISSSAQKGWFPNGMDESFPRSLLDKNEISNVRNIIANNKVYADLYLLICDGNKTNINFAFAESDKRRKRMASTARRAAIAKNATFVLLMSRKPDGITPLTSDDKMELTGKILYYLKRIKKNADNCNMFAKNDKDEWAATELHQYRSVELIMYMQAYDMLMAAIDLELAENPYKTEAKYKRRQS